MTIGTFALAQQPVAQGAPVSQTGNKPPPKRTFLVASDPTLIPEAR